MAKSDFKFAWPFRVRYAEVDGQKVVFNAHYLTYFDTSITEYFQALPFDYMGRVELTGEDFHTVRTLVEYKQPILFNEDIEVHVRVSRLGRSSLTFLLESHSTIAFVNHISPKKQSRILINWQHIAVSKRGQHSRVYRMYVN